MVCLPPPQNWVMGEGGRLALAPAAREEAKATTKTVTVLLFFTMLLPARRRVVGAPSQPQEGCHAPAADSQGVAGVDSAMPRRAGRHFFSGAHLIIVKPPLLVFNARRGPRSLGLPVGEGHSPPSSQPRLLVQGDRGKEPLPNLRATLVSPSPASCSRSSASPPPTGRSDA